MAEKEVHLERVLSRIDSLKKRLELVRRDILKRDILFNLSRICVGDFIVSFRASGGGFFSGKKNELSIKRLDEIFGYYEVNNNIILERHKIVKENLQKFGLIDEDSLVEATFKTDTYFIRKDKLLKNLDILGITEKRFAKLNDKDRKRLLEEVTTNIRSDLLRYLILKLQQKEIILEDPICTITCGVAKVERYSSMMILFEKKYYEWNQFFWQRIAKSNSMKASVMADLDGTNYEYFTKRRFDSIVEEIKFLNDKLKSESPALLEDNGKHKVLKKEAIKTALAARSKKDIVKYSTALEYFKRLKILEEIVTYPVSIPEAMESLKKTEALVRELDNSIKFMDSRRDKLFFLEHADRKLESIFVLAEKAIKSLNIDYRNPEFNSDIKFFHDSSSLKVGKYYFIYLDIKDAGLRIRSEHEKILLDYFASGLDEAEFMKSCFYAYEGFIGLISRSQMIVKDICSRLLPKQEILYLAFGDEIFVLLPHSPKTKQIMKEIKARLEVNVRIVSTSFDINKQINELGSGRQIIEAFEALRYGNDIVKKYERANEGFNRIVLVDSDYSHRIIDEMSETAGHL